MIFAAIMLPIAWPQAHPAPPPALPVIAQTPKHLALADALVAEARVSEQQMKAVPQIVEMIMPIMAKGNESRAGELQTILRDEFVRIFTDKRKDMERVARDAYARNLNDQELRDVTAFYRTPTGKRLIDVQPTITSESMRDGGDIGRSAMAEAMPFIIERMRKANLKVPERT
jgi:hypothetical protein